MHSSRNKQKYEKFRTPYLHHRKYDFRNPGDRYGGHHKVAGRPSGQCL